MIPMLRAGLVVAALAICPASSSHAGQPIYVVTGNIAAEHGPSMGIGPEDFEKIGFREFDTKVLTLGDQKRHIKGVLARDVVKYAGGKGGSLKVSALDGYIIDIPMSDIENYDVVIATEIDGKKLSVRDRGPAWMIYPVSQHPELDESVYESRSVWQIKSIEIN